VLNLADILELVDDSLDEGTFAQKQAICQGQKNMAHVLAQFGDEAQSLGDQELLGEGLRDVVFIAEEATEKPVNQAMHRTTVVGVPGVRQKASNSARSLTTRWSLNP
jgi:hypothetical protein